jgi:6-phosphofructokinase 1
MLPTMVGAADRCVIPEQPFDIERLAELLVADRQANPSKYAVVLVSEGAVPTGESEMTFEGEETDQYGHRKLGGVGDRIAARLKELSPRFAGGQGVNVISQRLGYLVRSGEPDAVDSVVPMAFGNLALDLLLAGQSGRLASLRDGRYCDVPVSVVSGKKTVNVAKHYNAERLRPRYETISGLPLLIMTSEE